MEVNIRPADISDANTICDFQIMMARETENISLNKLVVANGVKAVFEDQEKGQYYVAEVDGHIVGSCLITYEWSDWRNGLIYWIQSVYVLESYRGNGVFKAMYQYLKQRVLEDETLKGLRLYVESENKLAQQVYSNLGMNGSHYLTFEWIK